MGTEQPHLPLYTTLSFEDLGTASAAYGVGIVSYLSAKPGTLPVRFCERLGGGPLAEWALFGAVELLAMNKAFFLSARAAARASVGDDQLSSLTPAAIQNSGFLRMAQAILECGNLTLQM